MKEHGFSESLPERFSVRPYPTGARAYLNTNITEVEGGYEFDTYDIISLLTPEQLTEKLDKDFDKWLAKTILDTDLTAAKEMRKKRNELLAESDSMLALDRLGLTAPSASTFSAWLSFFRAIGQAITGDWAKYRQELRDLPEKEGFPYCQFPKKPGE